MTMPDGPRHVLAGIVAAILFLLLFAGVMIAPLPALVLALGGYGLVLITIRPNRPSD